MLACLDDKYRFLCRPILSEISAIPSGCLNIFADICDLVSDICNLICSYLKFNKCVSRLARRKSYHTALSNAAAPISESPPSLAGSRRMHHPMRFDPFSGRINPGK